MEKVYKFPLNDLVNVKDELNAFQSELKLHNNQKLPTCDEDIRKLLEIEDFGTFQKLENSVDLDVNLSQVDDVRVMPFNPSTVKTHVRNPIVEIPKDLHLNTFREMVLLKKKFYGNPLGPSLFVHRFADVPKNSNLCDVKPLEDFIISIRVYKPFHSQQNGPSTDPKFAEEFVVRGQQYLSELRDKISCECKRPLYDVSEDPDQDIPPLLTDPGFFFVTDTFYNDTRNAANPDYSDVILKWAETRPNGTFTRKFKTAKMEETKFVDLDVRLGFPQVYQHFGNCEHVMIFSWIQIICKDDCLASKEYPILRSMGLSNRSPCNVCGERDYTFIVRGSDRHMHDPVYLCRICLKSFHYVDGAKVGEFEAFCENPEKIVEVYDVSSDEVSDGDYEEVAEINIEVVNVEEEG